MAHSTEPLTLRQAAQVLNWGSRSADERRLKRHLRARETELGTGRLLMGRGRLKVSLATLYRLCPELRPSPVREMETHLRDYLASIDDRMRIISDEQARAVIADEVDPALELIRNDVDRVARTTDRLGMAQAQLDKRMTRLESSQKA